jgi:hypothetical protein
MRVRWITAEPTCAMKLKGESINNTYVLETGEER